jgi:hypothetical protein
MCRRSTYNANIIRGKAPMSIQDLHDLAARLHEYRENQRSHGFAGSSEETRLLADALIQAVHEIANLARRVSTLEGPPQSN